MAGSAPRSAGDSGVSVAVVVGLVVLAVGGVEFLQPGDGVLDRRVGGQVQDQRLDLGAQEVVRAGGAQRAQARVLGGFQEVQDDGVIAEVPQLRLVRGRQSADHRCERGGLGPALGFRQRAVAGQLGPEGLGLAVVPDVLLGLFDDPQRVLFGFFAGGAPGGDAVAAQDGADGLRVGVLDRGDVQAQLETGTAPGHPENLVAEDLRGQRLAVHRGGNGDPGVRVQVVHVRGVHEAVHGGIDRGRGAALAVQAVIESGHHLVFALNARVDVLQRVQPVQAQHREVLRLQRAQVPAGALDPQQLDVLARYRVLLGALGGGVAAGEVGVPLVRAQAVGTGNQVFNSLVLVFHAHA